VFYQLDRLRILNLKSISSPSEPTSPSVGIPPSIIGPYREIPGESGSTYTVRPEDSGKFIRVYVVSDSNPPVVRYDTIKLDVFGTVNDSGGESQSCDVVSISNAIDFMDIINNLSGCYELTNDIDLSGISFTQSPINTNFNNAFEGSLNGNGFSISGLTITSSLSVGLFTFISDATIENITLSGINIIGNDDVGILAGYSRRSLIDNVNIINSNVSGSSAIGSMVGVAENSTIQNSQILNVSVNGTSNQIGGLVGRAESNSHFENIQIDNSYVIGNIEVGGIIGFLIFSTVSQVSFNGTVDGVQQVGGIIGELNISTINEAFNSGTVSSTEIEVGGIVGFMTGGSTIEDSYTIGNVTSSSDRLGGIVGSINGLGNKIINSYAAANVTGSSNIGAIGAIVGHVQSGTNIELSNIYWNTNIFSGDAIGYTDNAVTSGSILGITNGAMILIETFNAEWNIEAFSNTTATWTIGFTAIDTFPWLSWQEEPNEKLEFNSSFSQLIEEGSVPIATLEDFMAINSSSPRTFAEGSKYATYTSGGPNKNYFLVNNVDLSSGSGFTTSVVNNTFTGTLDGNNFTISNLKINNSILDIVGLFKALGANAKVHDLVIENFNVSARNSVGSLAGRVENSSSITIENVSLSYSTIIGTNVVGGIIGGRDGNASGINITFSSIILNNTVVSGSGTISIQKVGGIIGELRTNIVNSVEAYMENITINVNINSAGTDINNNGAGGLIGSLDKGILTVKFVSGSVIINSPTNTGGIIGIIKSSNLSLDYILIEDSSINGVQDLGGIIGKIRVNLQEEISDIHLNSVTYSGFVDGSFTGVNGVGGIFGDVQSIGTLNIKLSAVSFIGEIAGGNRMGGIFGRVQNKANITGSGISIETTNLIQSNLNRGHVIGEIGSDANVNLENITIQSPSTLSVVGSLGTTHEVKDLNGNTINGVITPNPIIQDIRIIKKQ
jgi:hypothetical protein